MFFQVGDDRLLSLSSSLLFFFFINLPHSPAVYLLSSRHLIFTLLHQHTALPLHQQHQRPLQQHWHAAMSLFLNGPQNVELHKSLMGRPSSLYRRGFAISEIINNSTACRNFPAPSCVSAMCHWFGWYSVRAPSA